ncbi:PIG-L family deacetylase [bacterium]|nr:PIG-L family deacetylase [bacterium]
MKLNGKKSVLFVPDGKGAESALARVTHMGIGAHPDDLEFMTWSGILAGFTEEGRAFAGVTLTDGGGSSRVGPYGSCSDEEMKAVRLQEQKKAAFMGNYAALAALGYTSAEVRGEGRAQVREDLKTLIKAARPEIIFTHNPADRHLTHLSAFVLTLEALRELGEEYRPKKFYGCEVWRSLDWLAEADRRTFDVGQRPRFSMAMMGLYDSQISGGKNYDEATFGRRMANATYADAYNPDKTKLLELCLDLTPLLQDPRLSVADFMNGVIGRFRDEVLNNLQRAGADRQL